MYINYIYMFCSVNVIFYSLFCVTIIIIIMIILFLVHFAFMIQILIMILLLSSGLQLLKD